MFSILNVGGLFNEFGLRAARLLGSIRREASMARAARRWMAANAWLVVDGQQVQSTRFKFQKQL